MKNTKSVLIGLGISLLIVAISLVGYYFFLVPTKEKTSNLNLNNIPDANESSVVKQNIYVGSFFCETEEGIVDKSNKTPCRLTFNTSNGDIYFVVVRPEDKDSVNFSEHLKAETVSITGFVMNETPEEIHDTLVVTKVN